MFELTGNSDFLVNSEYNYFNLSETESLFNPYLNGLRVATYKRRPALSGLVPKAPTVGQHTTMC